MTDCKLRVLVLVGIAKDYPSLYYEYVRATTKLYTPATSKDNGRASSHCGLTQRDKLREKEEDGGICQFILTIDITTVKWES